nr:Tn3 family transposase [Streptosporangium minutum]
MCFPRVGEADRGPSARSWSCTDPKLVHDGRKGELRHQYQTGMEDQLGALGPVLNRVMLWNALYLKSALRQLRGQGYPAPDEDDRVRLGWRYVLTPARKSGTPVTSFVSRTIRNPRRRYLI